MPRPYWSGNLQISLVSFGVSLFLATESKSPISFHQISRKTGERIRHQKVLESDAESREPAAAVEKDEIVKGYEYQKGQYVIIEPGELEHLRVSSKHTIAVAQFVEMSELHPEYFEKPYYVIPENDSQAEAFGVVRQALVKTHKVAIGKVSFSGRENIVAVMPAVDNGGGMMAYTLRYQNELRDRKDYFGNIKQLPIKPDYLQLAESLIKQMTEKFDLSKFEDGYEVAVKALIDAKVHNLPVPIDEGPYQQKGKVINLMDALRESLARDTRSAKKPPKSDKEPPSKKIGVIKSQARTTTKRKSA
jgi:DNA end-binding protein Ku